jgi:hypothetical protein
MFLLVFFLWLFSSFGFLFLIYPANSLDFIDVDSTRKPLLIQANTYLVSHFTQSKETNLQTRRNWALHGVNESCLFGCPSDAGGSGGLSLPVSAAVVGESIVKRLLEQYDQLFPSSHLKLYCL